MVRVALFPGHVGKDTGAVDGPDPLGEDDLHTVEAVVTYAITSKIARYLSDAGVPHTIGIGSFDNRLRDTADCKCGVSIHADWCHDNKVRGFHVIHWPSVKGRILARLLDNELVVAADRARKVHERHDLCILNRTSFPVALIEVGFLTNVAEEADLMQEHHQYRLAAAIAWGIQKYIYNGR